MGETSNTSTCIVVGCDRIAALSDVTQGEFWTYRADYCSECFEALILGATPKLDASRLVITRVQTGNGCAGRFAALREMLESSRGRESIEA